ncbi:MULTISPECIES: hypothetical protein [Bacteroidales]|jgi:hypothetical protein|uniref:hypothetical protein n=1 Tax=Bacteroidales TaxID=171549 RepID=UPI000FFE43BC|nr:MULTISPECIES: hypothetical protein [Bacteroidales]RXE63476.1 hypothetical protein ED375_01080 [Muribaculaceae bacterium Isolate-004 (NCI)]
MSEEKRKLSAFEAFQQTQLTFAEAEEKAKQEAGAPKVERFRMGEDGEYSIRVLPLAPSFDNEGNILPMDRKGYEYAVHQFFLGIKVPNKKGKKPKKLSIPVIRTTDKEVGKSVDLLDTYVKIAKEMYGDDEALMKLLTSSSYEGGIRWNYQHALMVLDVSSDKERAKGPQVWQCSHSQYKDLDAAKMRLWAELKADDGQDTCPISGFTDAYPVKVIRKTENNKTSYTIEIGRKTLDITEAEAEKLLELPRLPEQLYRYTRYQMEATLAFLQQYDEEHDMEVCKEPDFIEAVETLKGELPADDTSHFDLANASGKDSDKDEVTIDSLYNEYDSIVDQGLNEKSDEYQELREKIRMFIEAKDLDVRISRTKNNLQLLEEIDEALDAQAKQPKEQPKEDPTPAPAPAPETGRRARRARPGSEAETASEPDPEPEAPEEKEDEAPASDSVPPRRLHKRRLR